jgi:hypothetical protein
MWPYRDWVIRSLNEDMPFDRFHAGAAGRAICCRFRPSRRGRRRSSVATGFHRNTVINEEGGVDPEQARSSR